jgi:hypothetical protein
MQIYFNRNVVFPGDEDMTGSNPSRKQKENIRLYRLNDLPQVELFQGVNIKRSFSRHRHWVFSISVVEKGNRIYHYRGKEYLAGPGDVKVICPGESHATGPADQQAYSMRAIRLEEAYFNSLTDQITRKGQPLTSFPQPLINDPDLFNQVINLYELLSGDSSRLEKEYSLVDMLTGLLIKYAPEYYTEAADVAIMPMKAIGDYICDHCHETSRSLTWDRNSASALTTSSTSLPLKWSTPTCVPGSSPLPACLKITGRWASSSSCGGGNRFL